MRSVVLWAVCVVGSVFAKEPVVELASPVLDAQDVKSVQRGAENFKKSCLACHSLRYARYNDVLVQAGINQESMPVWPEDSWGGHPPPDLSLWTQVTSPEYVYTYLVTYYEDTNSPTGFNNLAYPGTSMPNPFASMQGKQVLLKPQSFSEVSKHKHLQPWYRVITLDKQGSMSADEFDNYIRDLVNFLSYVADPSVTERSAYRVWVLGFLSAFCILLALIYRYTLKDKKIK